ncbi:MAG: hypothetical protein M3Q00_06195 [Pseudomonadota bacterium]|nr:hypothetical protein [Pseudomonadota bacterium]
MLPDPFASPAEIVPSPAQEVTDRSADHAHELGVQDERIEAHIFVAFLTYCLPGDCNCR